MTTHETVPAFSWSVEEVLDEQGVVAQRTLHIDVLAFGAIQTPQGVVQVPVQVRRITLPFGRDPRGGTASYERLALAMRGEEAPPEVQTAVLLPAGVKLSGSAHVQNGQRR